jgi:competence protein ComEA
VPESRPQLTLYIAAAVAVVLLGMWTLRHDAARSAPAPGSSIPAAVRIARSSPADAIVHVVGAVRRPGVYRLDAGARVQEAVRRAGGARRYAELDAINLAARIADGQQIVVPARAGARAAGGDGLAGAQPGEAGASGAGGAPAGPINLNTASAEQLDELDGVGPATARKILAWRQAHGGFRTVDDLAQVPGIGPKRLAALRPHVTA